MITIYCIIGLFVATYYWLVKANNFTQGLTRGIFWLPFLLRSIAREVIEIWKEE